MHLGRADCVVALVPLNPSLAGLLGDSFEIWANAAALYADQGDSDKALGFYTRALAIQPNSPEVVNNLGYLFELQV